MELEKIYEIYFKDIYRYIYGMSKNKAIADLSELKYNEKYKIYAKTEGVWFILNFC